MTLQQFEGFFREVLGHLTGRPVLDWAIISRVDGTKLHFGEIAEELRKASRDPALGEWKDEISGICRRLNQALQDLALHREKVHRHQRAFSGSLLVRWLLLPLLRFLAKPQDNAVLIACMSSLVAELREQAAADEIRSAVLSDLQRAAVLVRQGLECVPAV